MFGFLKKKWLKEQPTIEALQFPTFGWSLVQDSPPMKQWLDSEETQSLTINFFDMPPNLPSMEQTELRQFFRERIAEVGGGLIQVDVAQHNYGSYAKTIFKFPQEPSGMVYLGSMVVPFKDYSYVVKVQAIEVGTTGVRDTLILNELMASGDVGFTENGLEGWTRDPYEPDFKEGRLMKLSEAEVYDKQFASHPLSQVRHALYAIEADLDLGAVLGNIAPF